MKILNCKEYYIYYLQNPITNDIFYVGRTMGKIQSRLIGHISMARICKSPTEKDILINSLMEQNYRPLICLIEKIKSKENSSHHGYSAKREKYWINQLGYKYNLLNKLINPRFDIHQLSHYFIKKTNNEKLPELQ